MQARWWLCCVAVILLTACSPTEEPPLRIAHNGWPGYRPANLALELGYIDTSELHLVELGTAIEAMRALRNEAVDAAALTLDEVLVLAQSGYEIKVVLSLDMSAGGDAIIGRPNIQSMKDLHGKRIGVEKNALGAYVLQRALDLAGMQLGDVAVEDVELSEHERAWNTNRVEAVVTFDPVRTRLLAQGGSTIFDSSAIPGEIIDVLAVNAKYARNHSGRLRQFIDAWFKASDFMRSEPMHAARRLQRVTGMEAQQFVQTLAGVRLLSNRENLDLFNNHLSGLRRNAERLQGIMLARGLQAFPVDVERLFDASLLANGKP